MATASQKYLTTAMGEPRYTVTAQASSNFTAAVEHYYRFDSAVGTITITLPSITADGYTHSIFFNFTTSASPAVTFSGNGKSIQYYADYSLEASTKYEINALFNGSLWIIAWAKID